MNPQDYPEGYNEPINDIIVDEARDFFEKDEVSDEELQEYLLRKKVSAEFSAGIYESFN
jgi:hypothetical protein